MKINQADYTQLKEAIAPYATAETCAAYRMQGLSPKRFRWDCTYRACISNWICDCLYTYMNDWHLDTALRSIMKELNLDWASK